VNQKHGSYLIIYHNGKGEPIFKIIAPKDYRGSILCTGVVQKVISLF